jgi:regulator of protease activity HflC (stomatin/prohibitin superfamily)
VAPPLRLSFTHQGETIVELSIFAGVIIFFALITVFKGVRSVPQGYHHTVERFGRYTHTLTPGLSFIIPWIDAIGHKLNVMEQVLDVPSQEIITKDNAVVKVDAVVFYQVIDSAKAAYEVSQLELAILNLTQTNTRTVLGSMDLDASLSNRDEINAKLLNVVDHATHPWGVKVTRIEIKDIQPPKNLIDSMARQMMAEREKRANILEAEGARASAILRAEDEQQSAILEARGQRDAAFQQAEARERLAEAEARATTLVSDAIASGSVQAVNYFVAQKYVEALKEFAHSPNQKMLLLPMETTGILGALAGIKELAAGATVASQLHRAAASTKE